MARDKHSSEVQESFANCALDMKKVFEQRDHSAKTALTWTASALGNIISVLLAAARTREAWGYAGAIQEKQQSPHGGTIGGVCVLRPEHQQPPAGCGAGAALPQLQPAYHHKTCAQGGTRVPAQ
uniref:Uncharacterized protein n=1 Tax=Anguilla anguilla TaxID=7936 RepID=A0A0E9WAI5_ANGAN